MKQSIDPRSCAAWRLTRAGLSLLLSALPVAPPALAAQDPTPPPPALPRPVLTGGAGEPASNLLQIRQAVESAVNQPSIKPITPKFTALKARLTVVNPPQDAAQAQRLKQQIRRDQTLLAALTVKTEAPETLGVLAESYQAILSVCNDGFDYLSQRIKGNLIDDTRVLYLSGLAGLISGGTGSLVMAKTSGVLTAGLAAYKQGELLTPGTENSNQTLQSMMEDIIGELSQAVGDFNRWFITDASGDQGAKRFLGLKASLLAMNNACSFY